MFSSLGGDEKGMIKPFLLSLFVYFACFISLRFDIEIAFYIPALYVFNVDDYFRGCDGLALSNHVILSTYF